MKTTKARQVVCAKGASLGLENLGSLRLWLRLCVRTVLGTSVSLLLLTTGCQTITGSTGATGVLVRLISGVNSLATYDVFAGQQLLASGAGFSSITNYTGLAPGSYQIKVNVSGTNTQVAGTIVARFTVGNDYTILLPFDFPNESPIIVQDETQSAGGFFDIRFINEGSNVGAVDVYALPNGTNLSDAKPVIVNAPVGFIGTYLSLAPGTYKIAVLPTGTVPNPKTVPLFVTTATTFAQGQVRTLVLVDAQLTVNPPVNLLIASDVN
jgi:hypothetical protein